MDKNKVVTITAILLILLGIAMIYLGGFAGPKLVLPPVITGIGFFVTAWALTAIKDK